MIKDESGEGMPVASLITNREDICFLDPVRKPSRVAALFAHLHWQLRCKDGSVPCWFI